MGPRPQGDPAAMRAVAGAFRQIADTLDGLASAAPHVLPASAFEGPGRAEHDTAFTSIATRATSAGNTLTAEASLLESGATALAEDQRTWDREKRVEDERKADEARERSQRAAR